MSAPAVVLRGLTKRYGKARGIEAVDLQVEVGEVFGFLGPNGAGKTTTIRVLLDELRPTAGTAEVLGRDCQGDAVEVHRRIGYLPGDLHLYGRLTGRAHLDWLSRLRGAPAVDLDELVERFQVDVGRPIRELSKGNRQKIGLVQAFMHHPELLILDEPTAGLDPLMQDEFEHLLREVVGEGRTALLSSHSLDEVQHVADRVGIIREGRMVTVSSVDDLESAALRRVDIRLAGAVSADAFAGLPGVRDLVVEADGAETRIRLTATGDLDAVLKAAARYPVIDLLSQAADLDEIFLTFYRGPDGSPDAVGGPPAEVEAHGR